MKSQNTTKTNEEKMVGWEITYYAYTLSRTWEKVPKAPTTGRYRIEARKRQPEKK